MNRLALGSFGLLLLAPLLALAAPLTDYESRLQRALTSLQAAVPAARQDVLDQVTDLIPAEETVAWRNARWRVNNTWLHELARAFGQQSDETQRQLIYQAIQHRLAALLEHVQRVRQQPASDYQGERQRLTEILNRKEFQRHRAESWLSRLLRRAKEALAWLARLLPSWQRGSGPVPRLLEIIVWLLALIVVYVFLRHLLGGFRRDKQVLVPAQPSLSARSTALQTNPAALREEAMKLAQQGEYRSAVRYLYLSMLYELQERGLLQLNAPSTNSEYLQRLRPVVALYPTILYLTRRFEQFWYGEISPSDLDFQEFVAHYQTARSTLSGQ